MLVQWLAHTLGVGILWLAVLGSGAALADAVAREEIRDERAAVKVLIPLGARLQMVNTRVVSADLTQVKNPAAAVAQLPQLKRLTQLDLTGCKLTAAEVAVLSKLDKLERLNLSKTGVNDAGLAGLSSRTLRVLNLSGTTVTDAGVAALKTNLPKLHALDLSQTNCGDAGLADVKQLAELKTLNLSGSKISDKGLETFRKNPPKLDSLDLSGTKITNAGMPHVARLKQLTTLDLSGTAVTDAGIEPLKQLPQLKTLITKLTRVTYAGRLFVEWEQGRLIGHWRRTLLKDPNQTITELWSTGRLGLAPNEDKVVMLRSGPLATQPRVAPLMLNTTRFAILFADIVLPSDVTSVHYAELYNKSTPSAKGPGTRLSYPRTYECSHVVHFDHLDIIVTAPGQTYKLQIFDKGNTLVINGRHKFDLRAGKKYIVVRRDGSAREL